MTALLVFLQNRAQKVNEILREARPCADALNCSPRR